MSDNVLEKAPLCTCLPDQRDGASLGPRGNEGKEKGGGALPSSRRSSDTMDIDGLSVWEGEVDDGPDALNIKTTRGQVSGKEEVRLTITELL